MDTGELRQVANNLGRVAGEITEESFNGGRDPERLVEDLENLRGAAAICRGLARQREARAAQQDPTKPLCLGCERRKDAPGALACAEGLDTKEATTKRQCKRYEAE